MESKLSSMILKQFILGPIENNNYLLIEGKEAVLIDSTQYSQEIEDTLKEYNADLKYILLTHGHFDHILGVNEFKKRHPDAKVLIHQADKELLESAKSFVASFALDIFSGKVETPHIEGFLKDGDVINFAQSEIKVIHTPGHTKGGVCYLIDEDNIFTGDTLFRETVGRVDLPGGDFSELKSSIEEKLFMLNDNIKVYPGHGDLTTIGHEKVYNNFD